MKKLIIAFAFLLSILFLSFFAKDSISRVNVHTYIPWSIIQFFNPTNEGFVEHQMPISMSMWLFDMGIVDANGDNHLDIFTSNHNWRQILLIANEQGGYTDYMSTWELDQIPEFPGAEISLTPPILDKPGLYIYWLNRHLIFQAYKMNEISPIKGALRSLTELSVDKNNGFILNASTATETKENIIDFLVQGDATLDLKPRSRGLPINFHIDSANLTQIYIGNQKKSPTEQDFSFLLQDRHGLAWNDFNNDGQVDVFITRGAIGGTLRMYPENIVQNVQEEFFLSTGIGKFQDSASKLGIKKNDCSSRHVNWVDFNNDGLLDLFINCEDVGVVAGDYPKQLYRQTTENKFVNVAAEVGLEIKKHHIIDFEWLDADNDGDMDLFTYQDDGFYLYRNQAGIFSTEFIYRGKFARIDNPKLKGPTASHLYWGHDGKITVADYDLDGDLDVFSASKKGTALIINNEGTYAFLDPKSVGLPQKTVSAAWVDYDNDGLPDLHTVPEGLFHQNEAHQFQQTDILMLPLRRYNAAIINWFDLDNNGTRDVSIALNENETLNRWWEFSPKENFEWPILTYKNINTSNHWLQVKLIGKSGNKPAIGSRITISTPKGQQVQEVGSNDSSFYSQGHYRLYFGMGQQKRADVVKIHWYDGYVQELTNVPSDSLLVVERKILP